MTYSLLASFLLFLSLSIIRLSSKLHVLVESIFIDCHRTATSMFSLAANVRASSCTTSDMRYLSFIWSCDDPNMEFDDSSPVLEIKDDQWTSGKVSCLTLNFQVIDCH